MKKILLFFSVVLFTVPLYSKIIFEGFESTGDFKLNHAKNAKINIYRAKGIKGAAIKINYDLRKDHFVEIYKKCDFDFKNVRSFSWYLKGNANGNIIEIKFVDEDGTTFGTKLPISGISETKWKKFTLSMRDLHYMWGGDQKVDKIKNFFIAISRGMAKKGYVIIDEFSYVRTDTWMADFNIQINQIGYHPTDKKFFIVRFYDKINGNINGKFKIKNTTGDYVYTGKLLNTGFTDWKGLFLKGDFSKFQKEGNYLIEVRVEINGKTYSKKSYTFKIKQKLLAQETLLKELNYIKYQRCGIRCHKNDPVQGGYHDTLFDISKRMWSIPSLVYGIAEYVVNGLYHPDKNKDGISDDMEELIWGSEFISKIPEKDGTVSWGGIEADFKKFMSYEEFIARIGPLKPEDDKLPRIKYKDKNLYSTAYNTIALINVSKILKDKKKKLSKKTRKVAITAWNWIDKQPLTSARDYGFYLWASTEMYKGTKDKKYLYRIKEVVSSLLKLQALNYNRFERKACGDFYTSENQKDFINQYKYVSFNISINMALMNLVKILPETDDLWFDIYYANRVYGESYLKNMASKTPYKQISLGLELSGSKDTGEQNYFAGPEARKAAADNHGLNCDHLARAYVAMKWGQYIEDMELEEFADNQVNWVLGENPLGYCMLIGAGYKNPIIMAEFFDKPKLDGIIPNGIVGGKNEEPEWWGDGPSSGEDWLPHNAAYFTVLSIIDNPAELRGRVLNGTKVVRNAAVEILFDKKIIASLKTDKNGFFKKLNLMPQREYTLIVKKNNNRLVKNITLLSGARKEIILNSQQNYDISIIKPKKIRRNKKVIFKFLLKNNNKINSKAKYVIRIKGGEILSRNTGTLFVEHNKTKRVKVPVIITGDKPFLFRIEIMGRPIVYKEIYLTI